MATTRTRREWTAHLSEKRVRGEYVENAGVSELTGNDRGRGAEPLRTVVKSGMSFADARLTAAAPDLADACAKVVAAINCNYCNALVESEYGDMLRAALGKAGVAV